MAQMCVTCTHVYTVMAEECFPTFTQYLIEMVYVWENTLTLKHFTVYMRYCVFPHTYTIPHIDSVYVHSMWHTHTYVYKSVTYIHRYICHTHWHINMCSVFIWGKRLMCVFKSVYTLIRVYTHNTLCFPTHTHIYYWITQSVLNTLLNTLCIHIHTHVYTMCL